ncbi:ankyrin repeat domain-containing protein [Leucobacter komagatae]|uniref:ankyrin repeat domain-containing protein n=1 Tax=Leucobacter komagatae TaxID=55969 RepID=UPI00069798AA|nr:ankyrin repeat domain-containing protein [Leucobacter komagatae]
MKNWVRAAAGVVVVAGMGFGLAACAPEPGDTVRQPPTTSEAVPTPAPTEDAAETPSEPAAPKLEQAELDRRLRDAAWANDVSAAKQLIEWGADVNAVDDTVQSPYLIATSEGRLELLRLTLEHGANPEALDSWDGTGLIRAAERGHWDISGELIRAGVPVDHVNNLGYQAIHEAVWLGRDDPSYHATLRVLVAGGAAFDTLSVSEGLTPLQMADQRGFSGQYGILQTLTGTPLPAEPGPALLAAAAAGDADAVALALRAGAEPGTVDSDGVSALEIAEAAGSPLAAQVIRALGG